MPEPLRIHLFGQPRLLRNGTPYKFVAPPRTLPLFAFMLLNRDAHLTRDTLAFTLWPDDEEEVARTNLRRHLNYLKNALPRDTEWFVTGGDTAGVNPEAECWLDVNEFEALVRHEDRLEDAVALYAGDLLPALYDDWIIVTRDRLRSTYLGALDALLLRARSARAFALAAGYARRILIEDPWREDALRHLISVRYESGDRTGALLEFDEFARRLERDVGVEPMPETVALRDLLMRGAALPESAGTVPDSESETKRPSAFGFVGREAQLDQLRGAWTRAARGRGTAVLVGGEAGMGKSRLASELALFAGAQGGRVLLGTTGAPESVPYQSLAEALRAAVPMLVKLDVRPIWLAALEVLVPEIATLRADLPALPTLEPQREQSRLFEALAATFSALGRQRPLLVILEDLHWAGASTFAAIEYIVRRAPGASLLVLGTYRSEEVETSHALSALRRRLANENVLASISLGGLSPAEVRSLVAQMPALTERSEAVGERIHSLSDGNPLFVGELVRDVLERGEGQESATELRAAIAARLGRLDERSRIVAEIASVAGMSFDSDTVRDVAGWSEHEFFEAAGDLLDRRIIREIGRSSFNFVFSHHLTAAALYAGIPERTRARWHLRIASMIEHAPERAPASTLAYHLAAGGERERAAHAYLAAARNAFKVYANAEACELATAGLDLHETPDDLRFELLSLRQLVFERLGDLSACGAELLAVETLAAGLGGDERRTFALQRRIDFEHMRADRKAELDAIVELRNHATERGDERALAKVLDAEANYRRSTGEFEEACRLANEACERYEALGDTIGQARALTNLALASNALRRPEADALIERAIALAETTNDAIVRNLTLRVATGIQQTRQDYRRLVEKAEQTLELCRSAGDRQGEAVCHHQIGSGHWAARRLGDAREHLNKAVELCEAIGARDGLARSLCNLGALTQDVGLYAEAEQIARRALALSKELRAHDVSLACELNLGLIREFLDDAAGAKRIAGTALATAKRQGLTRHIGTALAQRGMARRKLGEAAEAIEDLRSAIEVSREADRAADATEWLAYLALACMDAGRNDEARAAIAEALEAVEGDTTAALTVYRTQVYWSAARVYRACNDARARKRSLARAHEAYVSHRASVPDEWLAPFTAIAVHRELVAAFERDEWPQEPTAPSSA